MKTFDWEFAFKQTNNPEKMKWLSKAYRTLISEKAFVAKWSAFPRFGRRPSKKYSPSVARRTYRRLKEHFGFFS